MVYSFRHVRPGVLDEEVVSFRHHFDPQPNGGFDAVRYEEDASAPAVDAKAGDLLVWRFSLPGPDGGGGSPSAYIPNGDGPLTRGRYPSITVPR